MGSDFSLDGIDALERLTLRTGGGGILFLKGLGGAGGISFLLSIRLLTGGAEGRGLFCSATDEGFILLRGSTTS